MTRSLFEIVFDPFETPPGEHHLTHNPETMIAVGVEQCWLWCEASARRLRRGDMHDRLCREIADDWRNQRRAEARHAHD